MATTEASNVIRNDLKVSYVFSNPLIHNQRTDDQIHSQSIQNMPQKVCADRKGGTDNEVDRTEDYCEEKDTCCGKHNGGLFPASPVMIDAQDQKQDKCWQIQE
ncbi:MAG: hypothetical protein SCALA701_36510 [Candidatus Scalindua sp.]|nr:MAG: hypothetical protein SCALA701_36510 [Candidatus Scalindua sp.]